MTCAQVFKVIHVDLILCDKLQKKGTCNFQDIISAKFSQEASTKLQFSVPSPVLKSREELLHVTDTSAIRSVESNHFLVIGGKFFSVLTSNIPRFCAEVSFQ